MAALCSEQGILGKSGRIPDHPLQLLIERTKKDDGKSAQLEEALESLRKEMGEAETEKLSLERKVLWTGCVYRSIVSVHVSDVYIWYLGV